MSGYWGDLWLVLRADGVELDRTYAAVLGAPEGETLSLWDAHLAKHGWVGAIVACGVLSVLVQWGHCRKQLLSQPMPPIDAIRAGLALVVVPALSVWGLWWLL